MAKRKSTNDPISSLSVPSNLDGRPPGGIGTEGTASGRSTRRSETPEDGASVPNQVLELTKELLKPPAEVTKAAYANARDAMNTLGSKFTKGRKTDRIAAWKELQYDLMSNMGTLVPYAVAFEKVISLSMDIEDYLKGAETGSGKNPIDEIRNFLNAPPIEMDN